MRNKIFYFISPDKMAGVPPPASIRDIIQDLFQNEHYKYEKVEDVITFSLVKLTQCQKDSIVYPSCFKPLELFILYQTDHYDESCERKTSLSLASFVRKDDSDYVYALYYDITNQPRFHVRELWDSCHRIVLCDKATLTYSNYIEVYNQVKDTTKLLGFSSSPPYASLQYADCDKYYYENLSAEGITLPHLEVTELCGLSKNLHNFVERLCRLR